MLYCHTNINAGMRKEGGTEARTKTEQGIGKGKTTYFGIITILGGFKVLTELMWEIDSFYCQTG